MIIFKIICLFAAVFSGLILITKMVFKNDVGILDVLVFTVGFVGFVVIQWELYQ